MAASSTTVICSAYLIFTCICVSHAELHRASVKSGSRNQNGVRVTEDFHNREEVDSNVTDTIYWGHRGETWLFSLLSAVVVGLSGIFPLLVIPLEAGKALREGAGASRLKLLLSFAVGGLLGDVFLHLLPEAWNHLHKASDPHQGHFRIGLWVLVGIFAFLIIEKIFTPAEEQEPPDTQKQANGHHGDLNENVKKDSSRVINGISEGLQARARKPHVQSKNRKGDTASSKKATPAQDSEKIHISGYLNLFANVIDNFTHGLAVAGSYIAGTKVGLVTTFAILIHEVPHEVGDFAILLRSGFNRWKAAKAQLLTASGGVLGALTALFSESAEAAGDKVAWILPFTSGGFIYIALVTVVPDLLKETNPWESFKQTLSLFSGIAMMALITVFFE